MSDPIDPTTVCIRGCPTPTTTGTICDPCILRMQHALRLIPELMVNMRHAVTPSQSYELTERVQSSGDGPPAPLRIAALDASDALFAKLATIIDEVAETLHIPKPSMRMWMGANEVQGFRPVSAIAAGEQVAGLTGWLLNRLNKIASLPSAATIHDDIVTGHEDSPGVHRLQWQYGSEQPKLRPQLSKLRECPTCGKPEVFVKRPDLLDPEWAVMCGLCKEVVEMTPKAMDIIRSAI